MFWLSSSINLSISTGIPQVEREDEKHKRNFWKERTVFNIDDGIELGWIVSDHKIGAVYTLDLVH